MTQIVCREASTPSFIEVQWLRHDTDLNLNYYYLHPFVHIYSFLHHIRAPLTRAHSRKAVMFFLHSAFRLSEYLYLLKMLSLVIDGADYEDDAVSAGCGSD